MLMKKTWVLIFLLILVFSLSAQDFSDPVTYLDFINRKNYEIGKQLWNYMRISAHSRNDKRIAREKAKLIQTIADTKNEIAQLPPLNGKTDLRDSMVSYLDYAKKLITGELTLVEQMKLVAQKSFSAMQEYLARRDEISHKLDQKGDMVRKIFRQTADENNIKLTESQSKLMQKIQLASFVNDYYDKLFLIYFRNYLALSRVIDAISDKNADLFVAWRDSLTQSISWSYEQLKKIGPFNNDYSLYQTTKEIVDDFQKINTLYLPAFEEYFQAKKELKHWQEVVSSKPREELTVQEINSYNSAVDSYNAAVKKANLTMENIQEVTNNISSKWEKAVKKFMDKHVPR